MGLVIRMSHDYRRDGSDGTSQTSRGELRTAERAWRELTRNQRSEVLCLAKHDQMHPDQHVADIAYRWALLKAEAGEKNFRARPTVAVPVALFMLVVPGGGGWAGGTVRYWKTLRAARRIVRATELNRRPAA